MRRYLFLCFIASFALAACEGTRNNSSWSDRKEGTEVVPSIKTTEAPDSSAAADTSQAKH